MTLLLGRQDVEDLLDLPTAMQVTLDVLREQAEGQAVALPPRHLNGPRGPLRIVSGGLSGSQRMGVRVGPAGAFSQRNPAERMVALLYDTENGDLLSLMSYPFSTLRTGAAIGVATNFFARAEARTAAMVGTGRNALSLLRAVCHVRPIESIRVCSRNAERRAAFAERAASELARKVTAVPETRAATEGADVVCVATDSLTPVLEASWLSAGAFVASMGRPSELDPSVYLAAGSIVVSHKKHEREYMDVGQFKHQLLALVEAGQIDWNAVQELCDVAVGRVPARTSDQEIIVFKESQGGYGDMGFANWVYSQARQKGRGRAWNFE